MFPKCKVCALLNACPVEILQMIDNQTVTKEQRRDDWLKARSRMITASDVPSILGENFPQTAAKVLYQKVLAITTNDGCGSCEPNEAMQWGTKWEPDAAEEFTKKTGHKLVSTGLLRHATIHSLGASPDGITWCGKVLEIKCPWSKLGKSLSSIPKRYVSQVETQLIVTGYDHAYFVQFRPPGYGDKGVLEPDNPGTFFCIEYTHDPSWSKKALPIIERVTNDMARLIQSHTTYLIDDSFTTQ